MICVSQLFISCNLFQYTLNGGSLQDGKSLPTDINGIYLDLRGESLFSLKIPSISVNLTFTGSDYSWSLTVPYSLYKDKTEGLCGKSA